MENNREKASGWYYERAKLSDIEMWGTGAVLNHGTVPQGLYSYNLYTIGDSLNEESQQSSGFQMQVM